MVGCSKSPHVLVATSHRSPSRTTWVAWSPYTPGRSGRRKNRSPVCRSSRVSGESRHRLVWPLSKKPGPAEVALSQRSPSSRSGVPSAWLTSRRSRSPSWPKPPATDGPAGSSTRSAARDASSCSRATSTSSRRSRRARATHAPCSRDQAVRWVPVRVSPSSVGASVRAIRRLRCSLVVPSTVTASASGGAVVRQAQPHAGEVQRERRRRRGGGEGRRRGDVRRERGQGVQPALVGGDAGPGHQVDRAQAAHDLEAGQHRAIVAAGAAPPREGRCRKADQPSVIRGSPPTRPVPAMVHFPLRTAPPFHACRTHDRVAICAQ